MWKPARTKDIVNKLTEETKNVINVLKMKFLYSKFFITGKEGESNSFIGRANEGQFGSIEQC
mgnify:CR=1 FL=1